jgi:hypothetical protein
LVRTGRIAMVRSAEMKDENDGIDLDDSDI